MRVLPHLSSQAPLPTSSASRGRGPQSKPCLPMPPHTKLTQGPSYKQSQTTPTHQGQACQKASNARLYPRPRHTSPRPRPPHLYIPWRLPHPPPRHLRQPSSPLAMRIPTPPPRLALYLSLLPVLLLSPILPVPTLASTIPAIPPPRPLPLAACLHGFQSCSSIS